VKLGEPRTNPCLELGNTLLLGLAPDEVREVERLQLQVGERDGAVCTASGNADRAADRRRVAE
jgi:hypothetical protein